MQNAKSGHDDIARALRNLSLDFTAEEIHGQMCGVLLATPLNEVETWLYGLIGPRDKNNIVAKQAVESVSGLLTNTISDLNDNEFKFDLLLPDAAASLHARLKALASWCDGFLYGFALGQCKLENDSDSAEFVADLYEIAKVDLNDAENEDNELAFTELVEFIRMGVLLLQENCRPVAKSNGDLQ